MDLATVDHLLTTTRSVRKRLDFTRPVEPEVIERAIEIALQSPTASNGQGWSWMVVTDPEKRKAVAALYSQPFHDYASGAIEANAAAFDENDLRRKQMPRIRDSAIWLADHFHEAPALVIPCIAGRVEEHGVLMQASHYGSILPAVWSFMLALRARGIGSAWTTLHLLNEEKAAEILGIPSNYTQVAMLPVAYFKGDDFKPAERLPARELTHWNAWGHHRGDGGKDDDGGRRRGPLGT